MTNKGDIDGRVQLLPSFPPSRMFDPVDVKAGTSTKKPVWSRRRKHPPPLLFFGEDPHSIFVSHFRLEVFDKGNKKHLEIFNVHYSRFKKASAIFHELQTHFTILER